MSPDVPSQPRVRRLDIRVRRVMGADGGDTVDLAVYCPFEGRVLPLNDCARCASCQTISIDPSERDSFLICARGDQPEGVHRHVARFSAPADSTTFAARVTHVGDIMTRTVVCVRPDVTVDAVLEFLLSKQLTAVPVVDEAGQPIGVLSKTDLLGELFQRGETSEESAPLRVQTRDGYEVELGPGYHLDRTHRTTVGDIMTPLVFSVPETATVAEASALMAYEGVHRLVVVSKENRVAGIISSMDVLRWVARQSGYVLPLDPPTS
ncbi:MAG: hypothetical protein AMXMBFR64_56380 [Myxococcales bacterium]